MSDNKIGSTWLGLAKKKYHKTFALRKLLVEWYEYLTTFTDAVKCETLCGSACYVLVRTFDPEAKEFYKKRCLQKSIKKFLFIFSLRQDTQGFSGINERNENIPSPNL